MCAEHPPSENHASQGKNVRTNMRNSAFPRALSLGDWFESRFLGNSEDRFSRVEAHVVSPIV